HPCHHGERRAHRREGRAARCREATWGAWPAMSRAEKQGEPVAPVQATLAPETFRRGIQYGAIRCTVSGDRGANLALKQPRAECQLFDLPIIEEKLLGVRLLIPAPLHRKIDKGIIGPSRCAADQHYGPSLGVRPSPGLGTSSSKRRVTRSDALGG